MIEDFRVDELMFCLKCGKNQYMPANRLMRELDITKRSDLLEIVRKARWSGNEIVYSPDGFYIASTDAERAIYRSQIGDTSVHTA